LKNIRTLHTLWVGTITLTYVHEWNDEKVGLRGVSRDPPRFQEHSKQRCCPASPP